jgi:hypothetical protein
MDGKRQLLLAGMPRRLPGGVYFRHW